MNLKDDSEERVHMKPSQDRVKCRIMV